jgi:hypothetical protein
MNATFYMENLKERDHSEDSDTDGSKILNWNSSITTTIQGRCCTTENLFIKLFYN